MKYLLDEKELKSVAEAFEISEDRCKEVIDRINNYHANVECSLYGEIEHVLKEE